jgi:ribosome-associated translation inhibitor RaiA
MKENEINELEFEFEFYADEIDNPALEEELMLEADSRLRELADDRRDMIGASVAVEKEVEAETAYVFRARVVAYIKPDNIVAVEKESSAMEALKAALEAVERQVREHRENISEPWKKPEAGPGDHIIGP